MEFELKYIVPAHKLAPALAFIKSICRVDAQYPSAKVSSIYFDDPKKSSLYEKVNSDFFKCKVRLRWYDCADENETDRNAFFEVKRKSGSQRNKLRFPVKIEPDFLRLANLEDIRFAQFASRFALSDRAFESCRFPSLGIDYLRQRFIEPLSGCRVSVDSEICVPRINHRMMPSARPAALQNAVIEVKGNHAILPITMQPLLRLGVRKSSFSKYLSGYAQANRIIFDPR